MPWSELTEELAEILIEDAIERADEKGVRLDRAALSAAAKRRAAELVGVAVDDDYSNGNSYSNRNSIAATTRAIVKQLTVSAIDGNADAGELRERVLSSPAFSEARARMLARVALNGKRRA